jgi:hypothetical protein
MSPPSYTVPDIADDVTASEAASYAYCAKAWHLEHVLGKHPSRSAVTSRDAGTAAHLAHGQHMIRFRRRTSWLLAASLLLLASGIALLTGALNFARP